MYAKFDAYHEYTKWDVLFTDHIPTLQERIHRQETSAQNHSGRQRPKAVPRPHDAGDYVDVGSLSAQPGKERKCTFRPSLCVGHGLVFEEEDGGLCTVVKIPPDRGGAFLILDPAVTSSPTFFVVLKKHGLSMLSMGFVEAKTVLRPDIDLSSVSPYVVGDDPECASQYRNGCVLNTDGHLCVQRNPNGVVTMTSSLERGGHVVTLGKVPLGHRFVVAMNVVMRHDCLSIV